MILSAFVVGTLHYTRAQARSRVQVKSEAARHIFDDWFHDESGSHGHLIRSQMKRFIDVLGRDQETTDWNAFTNNCQHFCRKVLESDCFRRSYGRDQYPAGEANIAVGLPSTQKVLPMKDDRDSDISPFFAKYFNRVELDSMTDFGKGMVDDTYPRSSPSLRSSHLPPRPHRLQRPHASSPLAVFQDEPPTRSRAG